MGNDDPCSGQSKLVILSEQAVEDEKIRFQKVLFFSRAYSFACLQRSSDIVVSATPTSLYESARSFLNFSTVT